MDAAALDALACEACGAALTVEHGLRTMTCPYCAAPAVVARARPGVLDPSFVLGFVLERDAALEVVRKWKRSRWFVPTAFARADVSQTRGIYVPVYLHTASANATWSATIGEEYLVVETYTTRDAKGRTVTRTRTRTETEWRPLDGEWVGYLEDNVVTASRGLTNAELEAIEPFDYRALRRFGTKLLSGWIAEDPSMSLAECSAAAGQEAAAQIGRRLGAFMPGDKYRDLRFEFALSNEDLELILVPVWVLAVAYDAKKPPVRVVVNGQTGRLCGRPPRSVPKIVGLVIALLLAGATAWLWSQRW